jgi:hypothetical protein
MRGRIARLVLRSDRASVLSLLLVAVLLHVHGLALGFYLDDNTHLEQCAAQGYHGLASANTFDWSNRLVRAWWATDNMAWSYFRPLPVALRVTLLRLFGLHPLPWHVVQLILYLALLVAFFAILRRFGCPRGSAFVASLLFTAHPSHAMIAPWLASDNAVLSALAGIVGLCLMRSSAEAVQQCYLPKVGIVVAYAVAMLSRESGLMLGPILLLTDWLIRPVGRRPWGLYAALTVEGLAYVGLRSWCLAGAPWPHAPYLHRPTDAGFAAWLPVKLLLDFLSTTWSAPAFPFDGVAWLRARPIALVIGMGLAALTVVLLWPLRRSRAAWGVASGTALAVLPTITTFSAPYMLFLPSAGWAALLAVWAGNRWPQRPLHTATVLGGLLLTSVVGQAGVAWQMHAGAAAEHAVLAAVLADHPERYPPATRILLVNMPPFAAQVGPAVRLRTGRPDLEVVALTPAPEPYAIVHARCDFVAVDEHTVVARCAPGYFAGAAGDAYLHWFGRDRAELQTGPVAAGPPAGELPFRTTILCEDANAIQTVAFRFDAPVADPHYRFFVGSRTSPAARWPSTGNSPAPQPALARALMCSMQLGMDNFVKLLDRVP